MQLLPVLFNSFVTGFIYISSNYVTNEFSLTDTLTN